MHDAGLLGQAWFRQRGTHTANGIHLHSNGDMGHVSQDERQSFMTSISSSRKDILLSDAESRQTVTTANDGEPLRSHRCEPGGKVT